MQSETPHKILVVDDNPPFRHLVAAWLREAGHAVVEAADGLHGLEELQNAAADQPVSLILLDLQMEPMGGLNFMDELQDTPFRPIPVILITADPSSDVLLRASKMGCAGVMKKPIVRERLLSMIAQQLGRSMPQATALDNEPPLTAL